MQALLDTLLTTYPTLRSPLYDADGTLSPHVHILVNGCDARYLAQGLETRIAADDTITIFPPVGGGAA